MRTNSLSFSVVAIFLVAASAAGQKARNPFEVQDVPDPLGADVVAFARTAKMALDSKDANAAQWAPKDVKGSRTSLDGEWASRWNGGGSQDRWTSGAATVKTVGDWVYIHYHDAGAYLIEAKRMGATRLVGRYINLKHAGDSTPWVGEIVDGERIDGIWSQGRWDLRRKLSAPDVASSTSSRPITSSAKATVEVELTVRQGKSAITVGVEKLRIGTDGTPDKEEAERVRAALEKATRKLKELE